MYRRVEMIKPFTFIARIFYGAENILSNTRENAPAEIHHEPRGVSTLFPMLLRRIYNFAFYLVHYTTQ